MALDPIFRKAVPVETAKYLTVYRGKMYYFCAACSKKLFEEHPEKYVKD